jgi:hypothetical protein
MPMDDALICRMNELADRLLAEAHGGVSLQDRLAVFREVGAWTAIKHHIAQGAQRNAEPKPVAKRRGFEDDSSEVQRQRARKRWNRAWKPDDADGSGLPALRAMVSGNSGSNSD